MLIILLLILGVLGLYMMIKILKTLESNRIINAMILKALLLKMEKENLEVDLNKLQKSALKEILEE